MIFGSYFSCVFSPPPLLLPFSILDKEKSYWGTQVEKQNSDGRCYGIACDEKYILISEYGKDGADAEIVMLKRR